MYLNLLLQMYCYLTVTVQHNKRKSNTLLLINTKSLFVKYFSSTWPSGKFYRLLKVVFNRWSQYQPVLQYRRQHDLQIITLHYRHKHSTNQDRVQYTVDNYKLRKVFDVQFNHYK